MINRLPVADEILLEKFNKSIAENKHILCILRGLPGSGKTTLAKHITETLGFGKIFSTDEYFMQNGKYIFIGQELDIAHKWNFERVKNAMEEEKINLVFIDNTNLSLWEMDPYIKLARYNRYEILLLEPNTWWKYKIPYLAKLNSHNVDKYVLNNMSSRFERITQEDIDKYYPKNIALKKMSPLKDVQIPQLFTPPKLKSKSYPFLNKISLDKVNKRALTFPALTENVIAFDLDLIKQNSHAKVSEPLVENLRKLHTIVQKTAHTQTIKGDFSVLDKINSGFYHGLHRLKIKTAKPASSIMQTSNTVNCNQNCIGTQTQLHHTENQNNLITEKLHISSTETKSSIVHSTTKMDIYELKDSTNFQILKNLFPHLSEINACSLLTEHNQDLNATIDILLSERENNVTVSENSEKTTKPNILEPKPKYSMRPLHEMITQIDHIKPFYPTTFNTSQLTGLLSTSTAPSLNNINFSLSLPNTNFMYNNCKNANNFAINYNNNNNMNLNNINFNNAQTPNFVYNFDNIYPYTHNFDTNMLNCNINQVANAMTIPSDTTIVLDPEFLIQMQSIYQIPSKPFNRDDLAFFDRSVQINQSMAQTLYFKWVRQQEDNQDNYFNTHYSDNTFNPLNTNPTIYGGNSTSNANDTFLPPWARESPHLNISNMLNRNVLEAKFPTIDPALLYELFLGFNFDLDTTTQFIQKQFVAFDNTLPAFQNDPKKASEKPRFSHILNKAPTTKQELSSVLNNNNTNIINNLLNDDNPITNNEEIAKNSLNENFYEEDEISETEMNEEYDFESIYNKKPDLSAINVSQTSLSYVNKNLSNPSGQLPNNNIFNSSLNNSSSKLGSNPKDGADNNYEKNYHRNLVYTAIRGYAFELQSVKRGYMTKAYETSRRSNLAFRAGIAEYYRQTAREVEHKYTCETFKALILILNVNNYGLPPNTIDLHGLHVSEVLGVVKEYITWCQQKIIDHVPDSDKFHKLTIITGRGKSKKSQHSRLNYVVRNFLVSKKYRFEDANAGIFLLYLVRK